MATPRLIVTSEQLRGTVFELTKDEMTVGRSDERDICLKDPTVSSLHCKFTTKPDGKIQTLGMPENGSQNSETPNFSSNIPSIFIYDAGSTNGTKVNGKKLESIQELYSGDHVQIGIFDLLYDCEDRTMKMSIHKTQTGININAAENSTQSTKTMELSGFAEKKRNNGMTNKLILMLVIVLVLIFLVLLSFFILKITGKI